MLRNPFAVFNSTAVVLSSDTPAILRALGWTAKLLCGDHIQICDGVNDHVEIQAALDVLPATGGEVKLLDGTYNCEAQINLDSYQTLRGCGRNTILTTATADLRFISAVGTLGAEKEGIEIADLKIDGQITIAKWGIYFEYVNYSILHNLDISNVRNNGNGIHLYYSDHNAILNNQLGNCSWAAYFDHCTEIRFEGNEISRWNHDGVYATYVDDSVFSNNVSYYNNGMTFKCEHCTRCVVSNNEARDHSGAGHGLYFDYCDYFVISGNALSKIDGSGIHLQNSDHNIVLGNNILETSQVVTGVADCIHLLTDCSYNLLKGNTCRAGTLANKPNYGINLSDALCVKNIITGNDLYDDGFVTGSFNDAGTLTHVEDNNRGIRLDQIRHFRRVQNTSGAQRVAGDVVSLKAVANGYEVTAPAAVGERQVFGMVAETINDNEWGLVQVKGKTSDLKSTNVGGGNIVIGDNLITENGVRARKAAAATDPIFARALEACAAADCVIDAYIKSPWD